ncbi:MAG: hypothetical protein WC389_02740 [Lutibacter sp.]
MIKTYKKRSAAKRFMQSVQLPNVGILLSKKGYNNEGADVGLKVFVNYKNIGSGTKSLNEIPI